MKNITLTALIIVSFLSASCVSTGNKVLKDETSATIAEKLSPGMSQEQVAELFGEPLDVTFTDSGNEIWKYAFSKSQANVSNFIPYYSTIQSGSSGKAKSLVVFFDTNGKLVRHNMSASDIESRSGILP